MSNNNDSGCVTPAAAIIGVGVGIATLGWFAVIGVIALLVTIPLFYKSDDD